MDAVRYLKEKERMCNSYNNMCDGCGFGEVPECNHTEKDNPEKAVEIVEKWSSKHPVKTRQSEFLKMFPNAEFEDNIIKICPCQIDTELKDKCHILSPCYDCRKRYWLAEVK